MPEACDGEQIKALVISSILEQDKAAVQVIHHSKVPFTIMAAICKGQEYIIYKDLWSSTSKACGSTAIHINMNQ